MVIIGLIGRERVGKDTFADFVCQKYKFKKYNLAQPIKEIAKIMFGWDDAKLEGNEKDNIDEQLGIKPRDFFTWFGTDIAQLALHQQFPNLNIPDRGIWSLAMDKWIQHQMEMDSNVNIIIPDIRFCHEIEVLMKYNAKIINITKPDSNNFNTQRSNNNYQLDEILGNYPIHYVINNNGTLETYKQEISYLLTKINNQITNSLIYDEELKTNYTMYI